MAKTKSSGKALTGILCFIFGFLFAIIVEVGAVFGVGLVVLNTDVNYVMERIGYPNDDDKYINTDRDNGGSQTIGDLIKNVYDLVSDYESISVDEVEALVPAMSMLMDQLYEFADGVVTFDEEKLESATVTTYLQVLQNTLINIHTAGFLDKLADYDVDLSIIDNDDATGKVLSALLKGVEADYATVKGGDQTKKFPVLFDTYMYSNGLYNREKAVNGVDAYPANLSTDYLCSTTDDDESERYKLFYVPCKITSSGIEEATYTQSKVKVEDTTADGVVYQFTVLTYGEDTVFIAVKPDEDGNFYLDPTEIAANPTGCAYLSAYATNYYWQEKAEDYDMYQLSTLSGINYFYNQAGEMIEYDPLLIYDLMTEPYASLYALRVSELIPESEETDTDLIKDILGNVTMGELLNGEVDVEEKVKNLEISRFDLGVTPDNAVMAKIIYNLSDITQNGNGTYSAVYDKGGEDEQEVTVTTKDGGQYIYGAYPKGAAMTEDNLLKGTTVGELADISKNISVGDFVEIKASDAILLYIGYGVNSSYAESGTDQEGNAYDYKGVYDDTKECYISVDDDGKVKDVWYYENGEYTEVGGTLIADVGDRVSGITDKLTLPDVMDVDADSAIMAYIGYGITDVKEESGTAGGKAYDHVGKYEGAACYIKTEKSDDADIIVSAWTYENETLTEIVGTKISGVSDRVENITDVLTIPDVMDVNADSAIMAYIGYGITDVKEESGTAGKAYDHVGLYNGTTCYIETETKDGDDIIVSVWTYENSTLTEVGGTKISEVSDRVENITDVLALSDVMDVDADSAIMAYIGYGITDVKEESGTAGKAYDHVGLYNGTTCYIETETKDGNDIIVSAWTYENSAIETVAGTKISGVSDRVDNVTDVLALSDVMDVDADSAIMVYIGFGITDVKEESGTAGGKAYDHVGLYNGVTCYMATETKDGSDIVVSAWTYENSTIETVAGTKISDTVDRVENVTDVLALSDVMDVDADSAIMAYIGYGVTEITKENGTTGDKTYTYKGSYNGTTCYIETETKDGNDIIVSVWTYENETVETVAGTKISEVPDKVDGLTKELTIGDVVEIDDNSSQILLALKDTKIAELDSAMQELTVADVFTDDEINASNLLKQLKNTKLMELDTAIDEISVQRIYSKEIYGLPSDGDPMEVVEFNASYTYYTTEKQTDGTFALVNVTLSSASDMKDGVCYYTYGTDGEGGTLKIVAYNGGYATDMLYYVYNSETETYELVHSDSTDDDAVGRLTSTEAAAAFTSGKYYTYGRAQGMWKIVLYKDGAEKSYTINNFNNMISACASNVYSSTLGELQDAGIIDASDEELSKKLTFTTLVDGELKQRYVTADGTVTGEADKAATLSDMTFSALMYVVINNIAQ